MSLSDNLVAYWSLDEASGNAIDAHASNDLTDNNTVGTASGVVSGCRDFEESSSEYFSIADNTDLSTGDIDFTFAFWLQLESKATSKCPIVKADAVNAEYYLQYHSGSDRLQFLVYGATGFGSGGSAVANTLGSPSTSTWYFVVCWHDSVNNQVGIAVNGGTADTASHSAGVLDGTSAFHIGSYPGFSQHWDGLIDEVGFWKRVLTADERTELYNSGSGRDYAYIAGGAAPATSGNLLLLGVG